MMTETEATEPQTDEEPKPVGLTALDLKALREANMVSFHQTKEGQGFITATKRLRTPTPWEDEKRYEIRVESLVRSYRNGSKSDDRYACHYLTTTAQYDEHWRTVASLLRVGDVLVLKWNEDAGSCPFLEQRNLHGDSFELVVRRGEKTLTFLLEEKVNEDYLLRMIRRVR